MKRILKEPFVQFLLLGALIFAVYPFSKPAEQARSERRIVVDAATQAWLFENFQKQFRRPPTPAEMEAMVEGHIETEIKFREAMEMGLDEGDAIVERRLAQKFDFLFGNAGTDVNPDEATLRAWYEANTELFAQPGRVSFAHLWFSPDRRPDPEADARVAMEALRAGSEAESTEADHFPFGSRFEAATPDAVRREFGAEFTEAVFDAPVGEWSGPVKSGLGQHLVRVSERQTGSIPAFEDVRAWALQRWREEESKRVLEELMQKLRAEYEIEIDREAMERLGAAQ